MCLGLGSLLQHMAGTGTAPCSCRARLQAAILPVEVKSTPELLHVTLDTRGPAPPRAHPPGPLVGTCVTRSAVCSSSLRELISCFRY